MLKVVILQDEISSYNVPFFNELAKRYSLTVGYYREDKSSSDCFFEKHRFKVHYWGPFYLVHGVSRFCRDFDVVVTGPNLHVPSCWSLPFKHHKYGIANWSIGFRVSYTHPYAVDRKHNLLDALFLRILNKCDASVFYMEKAKEFWRGTNLDLSKVFIAPNTTEVKDIPFTPEQKKDFIFVGTLYKGKGLDLLINAFAEAKVEQQSNIQLHIIGGGEEKNSLESLVLEKDLQDSVFFHGAIFDESILAEHFRTALLSFSPTQAGLSVPKSMGYGVPFVTRYDSITGGEIYHITNGINGVIYKNDSELKKIMIDAMSCPDKYIDMGLKAKEYYNTSASISVMAKGMADAIEFAYKTNKNRE